MGRAFPERIKMNPNALKGRSLVTLANFDPEEIRQILAVAKKLKSERSGKNPRSRLRGRTFALFCDESTLGARASFETALGEEGAHVAMFPLSGLRGASVRSVEHKARVLGSLFDGIAYGGDTHEHVELLARYAGIPVYNAGTPRFAPIAALADYLAIEENTGTLKGATIAFVGDGRQAIARSLLVIGAKMGCGVTCIGPARFWPDEETLTLCRTFAETSGSVISCTENIHTGARGAVALYCGFTASSNPEFSGYRIDSSLMIETSMPRQVFLHGFPEDAGEEVSVDVVEGLNSKIWQQAENGKYIVRALALSTL